jgi:putative N6-adenine-specific DNA methylase
MTQRASHPRALEAFATCTRGLEEVVAAELAALGASRVRAQKGGVAFESTIEIVWRACLCLRAANHVLLRLAQFDAPGSDALYAGARKAVRWGDHLTSAMTFAVDFTQQGEAAPTLRNTHFAALRVKDAIVDALRDERGLRPSIDTRHPDVRIRAHHDGRRCTIFLDASGDSLHRRGYRLAGAPAPLKETLAAGIILLTGWRADTPLCDPMCGSGTLLAEAAMLASGRAPGLGRPFGFERWRDFDPRAYERVRDAVAAEARPTPITLLGSDRDPRAVDLARRSLSKLKLGSAVELRVASLRDLTRPSCPPGVVVCNPPYGERLGSPAQAAALYKELGDTLKRAFVDWRAFVLAPAQRTTERSSNLDDAMPNEPGAAPSPSQQPVRRRSATRALVAAGPDASRAIGLSPSRRHVLFNGPIECRLLRYDLYAGSRRRS